jgi:Type II secretion system (T2SS), protein E, N-terminal domain
MKLGTLLLRNAAIGLSQLEAALRNQVLYGGRLGTNLVELGYIDLELLSAYLAELSGFPIATPTLLDQADRALLDKLGADDAHRLRAIPLGYLGEGAAVVAVGLVEPTDVEAIEQVATRLAANVTPYIIPELRAVYYLEKLFGLPRLARFVRPGRVPDATGSVGEPAPSGERRRTQPAMGIVMPPALTLEPRRRRATTQAPLAGDVPFAIGYGSACERIDTATNRDEIADTFVAYAQGRCDALVVFLIRDGNALGWRSWVAPPAALARPIEELSLPLGGASSLQSAHDAGQPFVGSPPSAARPVEKQLWTALAVQPEPSTVLVVPVLVKQRAVNLVYAHIAGSSSPAQLVSELTDLASRAQTSYLRLIRRARGA